MPFSGEIERATIVDRIAAHPLGKTPDEMRGGFRRLVNADAAPEPPDGIKVETDARGLTVRPRRPGPTLIWFHGGGYVFGAPETHLRPAFHLAAHHGLTVHLPRYRLAPEHPWPAQLEDARTATATIDRPIFAGDSAGGHLALVATLDHVRNGGEVAGLMLFSPNTDRSGLNLARARMSETDPVVDDEGDQALARMCFGDMTRDDPQVSPALDDLSGLPRTHIEAGEPEVLLGDALALRDKGAAVDAPITLRVTPGMLHMGQLWSPWWAEARASLDRAVTATLG
ncbi:Monoterpene epsilon-lactone hydrolase [Jannaschia seosinensis]|uniref:Monoterpene epsilon-lactone hydrolase n=1 Tax=Jannaschia seosinensis TaxID=313367 RepID=A0A0M7BA41_9RHOB|nr:alpha/beta hydrolase fold domain-containing protein [Jannaschia seosinensis]CUH39657.1 Monoterpene epsilon-lactone hydrolase [Jannaschia seosinensis]